ncbi:MAG: outer membrane protein assembly factor BamA [Candidatus Pelagibacter sp.]|nr:outer membrane protein assembly factor BamA [Candidatus Pelagibacter sp.]OUW68194.1 MAG: outer membrane protein assembly factor BamA [Candidatus Pelagibacter sp. TMED202]
MKKFLILIYLLFFTNFLSAEIIKNIDITGNERVSDETIKVYGDFSINQNIDNLKINEIIKNLYSTNFFEDISISVSNQTLFIKLVEYPVINEIIIIGEDAKKYKEAIKKNIKSKKNGPFVKSLIVDDETIIKKLYSSLGFNFLNVNSKVETFPKKRVNLYFEIEKGEKTKISKINFKGDRKIRDRRLRDIITSQEAKFWKVLTKNTYLNQSNITLDKRLLSNYYKSVGYYDVKVISEIVELKADFQAEITFNINAGTRYKISKISTKVDPVLDKQLFLPLNKIYKDVVGSYYSPFTVKKLLDELDLIIANQDLQFIEHNVNEILKDNSIELVINVIEGQKIIVEKIDIVGNTITNETVIRSELLLDEGDPFSQVKVDKSIAQIKSKRIFSSVKETISDGSSPNSKSIKIAIEEMPTGEISAGAGIGTDGGSFSFSVKENNWLGQGVILAASADVSAESLKGALSFTDPNYNFTGKQLSYYIENIKNEQSDSGYENNLFGAGIGLSYEKFKDIYFSPGLSLTYDDLKTDSSASDLLKKQAGSSTDLMFDYALTSDKRDRRFMPTDGHVSKFFQELPVYSEQPHIKNSISSNHYKEVNEDIVGALKFSVTAINGLEGEDVKLSQRLNLPSRRLRGFEQGKVGPKDGEDYVGGNYTSTLNLEANFPNFFPEKSNADIGFFLDAGNVWGIDYSDTIDDSNKVRSSVGINTSWLSPAGPMSFIFSKNISKATTDVTQSFNFRLGTTF